MTANDPANLDRFLIHSPVPFDVSKLAAASPANLTLGAMILAKLRDQDPNHVFVAHAMDPEHRRLTYGELLGTVFNLAHGLLNNLGLNRGDRLAIVAPNHEHYHLLFFACLISGIIPVPMVPQMTAQEGSRSMSEAMPHVVVAHSSFYRVVCESLKLANMAPPVVIFDSTGVAELGVEGLKSLHDIMVPDQVAPPSTFAEIRTVDVAFMLFTSGTTGFNKAVELTHQMILINLTQGRAYATALTSEDQSDNLPMKLLSDGDSMGSKVACSGFFHLSGSLMGMATAMRGGSMFFMEQFDAGKWLDAIQRLKIGQLSMTPHNLVQLIKHPHFNDFDVSSLNLVFAIATPLSAATQVRIANCLKAPVIQGYASTETLNLSSPRRSSTKMAPPGTIGWLLSGFEAMIIDPETQEPMEVVQDGVTGPGEFVLRGPGLFRGYFNRPQETKDAFIEIGGKSWYRMGDVVQMDKDGCLTVVDRCKEMFKAAGNTVIPTEIESVILRLHDVADVVVVPVPAGDEQDAPCAAVVPRDSAVLEDPDKKSALATAISNLVTTELASYKHLTGGVVFLDAVPRNATGKIVRRVARSKVNEMMNIAPAKPAAGVVQGLSKRKPRDGCSVSRSPWSVIVTAVTMPWRRLRSRA
ncbi:hypothetical protein GGF32_000751 [Allomyces javanicus]|nr:hypothetical protein GGF32_000751 [Allomyces javanicus]